MLYNIIVTTEDGMIKNYNRNTIRTAKENAAADFELQINVLREKYDALHRTEGHLDENGLVYCNDIKGTNVGCEICSECAKIARKIHSIENEWGDWKTRAKRNKKKVGKRVEWLATREQRSHRSRPKKNHQALEEFKANRKEHAKSTVGIDWLYEGALVTKRGESNMMIVTRIAGSKAECLKDGTTTWFRAVSLRPADWANED